MCPFLSSHFSTTMASQPSSLQSPDLQTELNALLDKAIAISNELNLNNNEPSAFLTTTWTSTQINEYHQILGNELLL